MSRTDPTEQGQCTETPGNGPIQRVVEPRSKDLGGFSVERLLPAIGMRMVGPFVFLDHIGPAVLPAGRGMDVRPHPHIGLATVTYLFDGEIVHRDNLGYTQPIRPGAINWMTAGRGIAHSERSSPEWRRSGGAMHGLQLWVALPVEDEEAEPSFHHHPADTLPAGGERGAAVRVLAGSAYGLTAPVRTFSPLFYVDVRLDAGATIDVPAEYAECAAMAISGEVEADGHPLAPSHLVVLCGGEPVTLRARTAAHVVLLGGEPVGPRFIWWNLVSSSRDRIEQAKSDWAAERFPMVVDDATERIPLPAF
jgi:redox-sensitive bicupin YhaK (pirin superfamily)